MEGVFTRKMSIGMAVAGGVIIPAGLVISGILAGWKGVAGSFAGFALASLNTVVAMATLGWVVKKPPAFMPSLMLVTMWARLLALAGALLGLTYVKALDPLSMLFSFLALFIAYTVVEVMYAYREFGAILRAPRRRDEQS